MLLIRCPWCGERAQTEFSYEGDASAPGARDPEDAADPEWFSDVYLRANPRGPHQEYWQHVAGCRRFVRVTRDTATHEILAVDPPHPAAARRGR